MGSGVKGYRTWSPYESRVILSRNVIFDENSMLNPTVKSVVVQATSDVDKRVELQVTQNESESQHQGGDDQHAATETDLAKFFSHQLASS